MMFAAFVKLKTNSKVQNTGYYDELTSILDTFLIKFKYSENSTHIFSLRFLFKNI
jgi:hypothetical protein